MGISHLKFHKLMGLHLDKDTRGQTSNIFSYIIDVLNVLIRGIFMYFFTIMYNYFGYQDGKGEFQPILCMLIFLCAFEYLFIESLSANYNKNNRIFYIIQFAVFASVNFLLSRFISASKSTFFLISFFPWLENIIDRYIYRDRKEETIGVVLRNKRTNRAKIYGIVLFIISVLTIADADFPTEKLPIAVDSCMNYYYFGGVIYIAIVILLKYVSMQYRHSSKYAGYNNHFIKTQIRVDLILGVCIVFLFLPAAVLVKNTVVVGVGLIVVRFFLTLSNLGLSFISSELLDKLMSMFSMTETNVITTSESGGRMMIANSSFNYVLFIFQFLVVVFILIILLSLLKLYKHKGVQYKNEEEESTFIDIEHIKTLQVKEVITSKPSFSKDNRGKIRRYYYKYMNNNINKTHLHSALCNTTKELADNYANKENKHNVELITDIYRKARYSDEDIDFNEVKKMKDTVKKAD